MTLHQRMILRNMQDGLLLKRDSAGFPFFERDGERILAFIDGRTIASLVRRQWIRFIPRESRYELTRSGRETLEMLMAQKEVSG